MHNSNVDVMLLDGIRVSVDSLERLLHMLLSEPLRQQPRAQLLRVLPNRALLRHDTMGLNTVTPVASND